MCEICDDTYYPVLQPVRGTDREWVLCRDFTVTLPFGKVTIPAGSTTDFASIPRFLWPIFPPDGRRYMRAAIVHDYLYRTGKVPRALADQMFLLLMTQDRVPWWKRNLMYWAVRIFGKGAYRNG